MSRNIALIADDNDVGAERLCGILRDALPESFDIIRAHDGQEAFQILQDRIDEIAIAMLDMFMPGMDGMYILRLYSENGWQDLFPVFMVTSRDIAEYEDVCYKLGAYDFAKKPFDAIKVIQRVQHAVTLYQYQQTSSDLATLKSIIEKSDNVTLKMVGDSGKTAQIVDNQRGFFVTLEFNNEGNIL